jgi:hypothetical protein
MVSVEPACAAGRKVTRSDPRHESVHRGHSRGLSGFRWTAPTPERPLQCSLMCCCLQRIRFAGVCGNTTLAGCDLV